MEWQPQACIGLSLSYPQLVLLAPRTLPEEGPDLHGPEAVERPELQLAGQEACTRHSGLRTAVGGSLVGTAPKDDVSLLRCIDIYVITAEYLLYN